jgi:hypothetical protein
MHFFQSIYGIHDNLMGLMTDQINFIMGDVKMLHWGSSVVHRLVNVSFIFFIYYVFLSTIQLK